MRRAKQTACWTSVALFLAAPLFAHATAESAKPLDSLTIDEVHSLLSSWNLWAVADCLQVEQVDGDTLVFATEADFSQSVEECPKARPHHWKKLWRKLQALQAEDKPVEVPPNTRAVGQELENSDPGTTAKRPARRRLSSGLDSLPNYSGINMHSNQSFVSFGSASDVVFFRSGPAEVTVNGTLKQWHPSGSVSFDDVARLREEVGLLSAQLESMKDNVTTLQSHDYVYTWFEDVSFVLYSHRAADAPPL